MIPDRIIESIIERFSKKITVENEIVEDTGVLTLRTTLSLSGRPLYTHDLSLRPILVAVKEYLDEEDKRQ